MRIVCGWCGHITEAGACGHCGRDPSLPWTQRGRAAPVVEDRAAGRPELDEAVIRRRWDEVMHALGPDVTDERRAEYLDISIRTLRRWRLRFGL